MASKVFLIHCHQATAAKFKREPYSVQEMNHDFASGGEIGAYSSFSDSYAPQYGGGFIKGFHGGLGGSGGLLSSHIGGLSNFGMHDSQIGSYGSQIVSEGTSFLEHDEGGQEGHDESQGEEVVEEETHPGQEEAVHSKIKAIILESDLQRKHAEEKIEKMRRSFGYGTFGYLGYQYPLQHGPIDLGTHKAIDLGTTLDGSSLKDSHGKLKLPVQTVYITKTVGVPVPEPYPIKHEVPVPAPYPVPVPTHYSNDHYQDEHSYSSDDSSDSGKSSYEGSASTLSKVVSYHENLPKSTEKQFASASNTYARYLPSHASLAYRSFLTPTHYAPKQSVYEFK